MFGCCCKSSGWGALVAVAIVGVAGGVVGTTALDRAGETPAGSEREMAAVLASFVQPEGEMTPEQMMEFMKEWAALTPEHKELERSVGTWDCEAKFWMEPGKEPTVSKGASENTLILGGRFVTQHFTMPDFMGAPFEGYGTVGYDKQKGEFVSVWIDNFGTAMMFMTGEFDDDTDTWTWFGTMNSPIGESKMKHIVKNPDKDHSVMEFWEANEMTGGEFMKTGEITYTRR